MELRELLEIGPGLTALIGGGGKTTLCNLMARFWDVQSGSVRLGGRCVPPPRYGLRRT